MNLVRAVLLIVRRSLRQHAVSTAITVVTSALATGLVLSVVSIQAQAYQAFTGGSAGFDAVLGARGSQTQLVLDAVFHLQTSPGNVPWTLYEELAHDPRVELAIPYSTGDSYAGFRVVGTTGAIFEHEVRGGQHLELEAGGHRFDPARAEAVLGSVVAQRTGLRVGDTFHPAHGVGTHGGASHEETYVVTGVLRPTHTPSDRVVWIPIEGVFRMGGHVLRGGGETYHPHAHEPIPDAHKEVSAVMLKFRSPMAGFALDQAINRDGKDATLAFPIGRVMAELFDQLGWAHRVLQWVAYLVVVVCAGGIFASLYNAIDQRRREVAILRSLGARRSLLDSAIVAESSAIAAIGAAVGFAVHGVILVVAAEVIREQTGVVLDVWTFHAAHVWTPIGMVLLGAIAGLVPAAKAYATDVASHLGAPVVNTHATRKRRHRRTLETVTIAVGLSGLALAVFGPSLRELVPSPRRSASSEVPAATEVQGARLDAMGSPPLSMEAGTSGGPPPVPDAAFEMATQMGGIATRDNGVLTFERTSDGTYLRLPMSTLAGFPYDPEPHPPGADQLGIPAPAPAIPAEIQALDGKDAVLVGFMVPLDVDEEGIVQFVLSQNRSFCCYGVTPALNEMVLVRMEGNLRAPYLNDMPIAVFGRLSVRERREGGQVVSLYSMDASKVTDLVGHLR